MHHYFEGIQENLKLIPLLYPGWVMRLYTDAERNGSVAQVICGLACSDSNLDVCVASDLPGTPMKNATDIFPRNWRFFPSLDKQVDHVYKNLGNPGRDQIKNILA